MAIFPPEKATVDHILQIRCACTFAATFLSFTVLPLLPRCNASPPLIFCNRYNSFGMVEHRVSRLWRQRIDSAQRTKPWSDSCRTSRHNARAWVWRRRSCLRPQAVLAGCTLDIKVRDNQHSMARDVVCVSRQRETLPAGSFPIGPLCSALPGGRTVTNHYDDNVRRGKSCLLPHACAVELYPVGYPDLFKRYYPSPDTHFFRHTNPGSRVYPDKIQRCSRKQGSTTRGG